MDVVMLSRLQFKPVVLAYQFWAYKLFSVKVTDDDLAHEESY